MNSSELYQAVISKVDMELDELSIKRNLLELQASELKREIDDIKRQIWAKERTRRDAMLAIAK